MEQLTRPQKRDILLLASFYDRNRDLSVDQRWSLLRKKLKFPTWRSNWDIALGVTISIAIIVLVASLSTDWRNVFSWWVWAVVAASWVPFLWHQFKAWWLAWRAHSQLRVIEHHTNSLRKVLNRFEQPDLVGQPAPTRPRGDDRYELLARLQSILDTLGFSSIVVLMDRVDEPHLVHGSPERIRDLIWPMFDNKFLKHPGIAFKMLLPSTVAGFLNRQEKDFYERSRLDKQNLIPSLNWTGQGLYDVANDRIRACASLSEKPILIGDFFEDSISTEELIAVFDRLRAPRHLFKFLYRVLIDHCSKYTEDNPQWKIRRETLQSTLAVFQRDLEAYDQKLGTG